MKTRSPGWISLLVAPLVALALVATETRAWSEHASLAWPRLRTMPGMLEESLSAEPLEAFLAADPVALAALLDEHEQWAREALEYYAPRPDSLAFDPSATDLRGAFLAAIRVNPTLPYALYRQIMPGESAPPQADLRFTDLSFLTVDVTHDAIAYLPLGAGDVASPAQVLAAGSDEPDFGMDIGLFEDNGTEFGNRYGFGPQPFGNPNLEYSSQAPFHMGFYHLNWLLDVSQPAMRQTYPRWRVDLYRNLARFAFERGHDYWGWRFMGWALHYIGDMTQPYHADPLPGFGVLDIVWALLSGATADVIQLVSNRHGVLESYQYQRVQAAMAAGHWDGMILAAIADTPAAPAFDRDTLHAQIALESVEAAPALDEVLESNVPERFVSDPTFEWNDSGEEVRVVEHVAAQGDGAVAEMDAAVATQLARFGRYLGAWIAAAKSLSDTTAGAD